MLQWVTYFFFTLIAFLERDLFWWPFQVVRGANKAAGKSCAAFPHPLAGFCGRAVCCCGAGAAEASHGRAPFHRKRGSKHRLGCESSHIWALNYCIDTKCHLGSCHKAKIYRNVRRGKYDDNRALWSRSYFFFFGQVVYLSRPAVLLCRRV